MSESNRGRPKGSRNKLTNAAKEAIQMAFDELGGVERLVEWVKEDKANEFVFYTKIYPMLLPRPAPEPPPEPEAPPVVTGTLIWKAPDWAGEMGEAQLRSGAAQVAAVPASPDVRISGGAPPGGAEED